MHTLIIASTRPYAGKSGLALALLSLLADRGVRARYFKPYGTLPHGEGHAVTDEDAEYIAARSATPAPLEIVSPVVITRGFIEQVLAGEVTSYEQRVAEAFAQVSQGTDVMVVEGPSDLAQGRTLALNLCPLSALLDAKVLLVDRPDGLRLPDQVLWAKDCLGDRLAGVLFNAVSDSFLDFVTGEVTGYLERAGVRVFGTLSHDPLLSSASVFEIAEALAATVLCCEDHLDDRVERFMVGAMGQDKALRYFRGRTNKAVITGGDRSDVQLAALETDTRCLILTGNLPPASLVLARAEELGVPMLVVSMDTLSAVERLEGLFGRVRLHDSGKADRIRQMLLEAVDLEALLAAGLGL
jgi:hypothetical protein